MSDFRKTIALVFLVVGLVPVGCSAPTAAVDLISIARKGLASARKVQQQNRDQTLRNYQARITALDGAFDADVRMAEAGQLKDSEGNPVTLTVDWVISARKGYSAARTMLSEQNRRDQTVHATELDNIQTAEDALEMASQLIVLQWNVSERVKQMFLNLQRSFSNGQNDREDGQDK